MGYSDWATNDIKLPKDIWYRLSRRGADFLIESSLDGTIFNQMRIFHLHLLGHTTEEMGELETIQDTEELEKQIKILYKNHYIPWNDFYYDEESYRKPFNRLAKEKIPYPVAVKLKIKEDVYHNKGNKVFHWSYESHDQIVDT